MRLDYSGIYKENARFFHSCLNMISLSGKQSTILKIIAGGIVAPVMFGFSSLGRNKTSDYWVYDLKSCRSYDKTKRSVDQY